jgi:hypothetical protein
MPDEIEFRRVLAAPFPTSRNGALRDAIDIYVNGRSLSRDADAAPFDVSDVRSGLSERWSADGSVAVFNCTCGDVGCGGFEAQVSATAREIRWRLLWIDSTLTFDRHDFIDSLRASLAET